MIFGTERAKLESKMSLQIFPDMCRVCLMANEYLKEDFYKLTSTVVHMLHTLTNSNIILHDCLPSSICSSCYTRLIDSLNFKTICSDSEKKFRNYVVQMQHDTADFTEDNPVIASKEWALETQNDESTTQELPKNDNKNEEECKTTAFCVLQTQGSVDIQQKLTPKRVCKADKKNKPSNTSEDINMQQAFSSDLKLCTQINTEYKQRNSRNCEKNKSSIIDSLVLKNANIKQSLRRKGNKNDEKRNTTRKDLESGIKEPISGSDSDVNNGHNLTQKCNKYKRRNESTQNESENLNIKHIVTKLKPEQNLITQSQQNTSVAEKDVKVTRNSAQEVKKESKKSKSSYIELKNMKVITDLRPAENMIVDSQICVSENVNTMQSLTQEGNRKENENQTSFLEVKFVNITPVLTELKVTKSSVTDSHISAPIPQKEANIVDLIQEDNKNAEENNSEFTGIEPILIDLKYEENANSHSCQLLHQKDLTIPTLRHPESTDIETNKYGNEDLEFVNIKPVLSYLEPTPDFLSALKLIPVKYITNSICSESEILIVEAFKDCSSETKADILSNSIENQFLMNAVDKGFTNCSSDKTKLVTEQEYLVKSEVVKDTKKYNKKFKCSVCDSQLTDYGAFRRHLASHGECPYSCKICGKRFSKARALKDHTVNVHSGGHPYTCPKCPSKFVTLPDLTAHLRRHSGSTEPHTCPTCPQRFATARQLREHSSTNHPQKPSQSLQTSLGKPQYRLKQKSGKSATGLKNHPCAQCPRSFRKKCDLERHERVHSGEKPYECLICGGRFQQAHNLTKHMVTHTGVRSYTCDICRKTFGRSDVLARHMHVHEVSKPHSCQLCARTFGRHSQLISHMEKRHPDAATN